jgi:hypothetical protein
VFFGERNDLLLLLLMRKILIKKEGLAGFLPRVLKKLALVLESVQGSRCQRFAG